MRFTRPIFLIVLSAAALRLLSQDGDRARDERLSFQTSAPWPPRTNPNADVVMVYGIGPRMSANIQPWRQHGFMTGVAWGQYQDYLNGQFDSQKHWDQAQTQSDGQPILHGGNAEVPYISPPIIMPSNYDYAEHLLRLRFANSPEPLTITVRR